MIALVTGGAGVVGKALCRELLGRGLCVRVLTLPGDTQAGFLPEGVEVFYGNVTDYESIRPAFEGVQVVYHLAAILLSRKEGEFNRINACGTRHVVRAAREAGVERLVYVSSISVTYPVLTEYGKSKLAGERFVKECGIPWTIVRPTLVIGDGGGIEFNMYANYVKRFPVYFLPGGGRSLKRPVRSVDLVQGIASAGLSERSVEKTYALAGASIMSMAEMARCILDKAGMRHKMIAMPWLLAKPLAVFRSWIGGERVTAEQALAGFLYDAAPDITDAVRDLDYCPGTPF